MLAICIAHLFYGIVCFADMFILWCCLLQLSGRPTAHNKHHFSLNTWPKPFLSLCVFNVNPPGCSDLLCFSLPVMFISSSTSLWFLWSLFLRRICLCATGPALLKWWRGVQSVWEGDVSFVWCVHCSCSSMLSAHSSQTVECEENLIKSDAATCAVDWHLRICSGIIWNK